jgi:hypothetical protein
MHRPRGNPAAIGREGFGGYTQLSGDIDHGLPWGGTEIIRGKPQIAEGTELQGKAQAGMILALLVDRRVIGLR